MMPGMGRFESIRTVCDEMHFLLKSGAEDNLVRTFNPAETEARISSIFCRVGENRISKRSERSVPCSAG